MSGAHPYIGPWINWSHGAVRGSTITLSTRDGNILTSFLAILVTAAGAAVWKIASFWLHQLWSNKAPQDGVHQQRQVILRNTNSAGGAAVHFLQLLWAWRKNAPGVALRSLPLAILALLNMVLFAVAGMLSSEVTSAAGNETLVISPSCGFQHSDDFGTVQSSLGWRTKAVNDTKAADSYARECYGTVQDVFACGQYVRQSIPWKVNTNASCPFSEGICKEGDSAAYEMDTGPIDSHGDLGINRPKSERISYRRVTTCSALHTKGYVTILNGSDLVVPTNQDPVQYFNFGPSNGNNFTFAYNVLGQTIVLDYTLRYVTFLAENPVILMMVKS
ncbi:MAG: hypothetical protein Q9218_003122 [Villophora microphyllina]